MVGKKNEIPGFSVAVTVEWGGTQVFAGSAVPLLLISLESSSYR